MRLRCAAFSAVGPLDRCRGSGGVRVRAGLRYSTSEVGQALPPVVAGAHEPRSRRPDPRVRGASLPARTVAAHGAELPSSADVLGLRDRGVARARCVTGQLARGPARRALPSVRHEWIRSGPGAGGRAAPAVAVNAVRRPLRAPAPGVALGHGDRRRRLAERAGALPPRAIPRAPDSAVRFSSAFPMPRPLTGRMEEGRPMIRPQRRAGGTDGWRVLQPVCRWRRRGSTVWRSERGYEAAASAGRNS